MTAEQQLAGHRVLRLLAAGAHSRVWLAPGELVLKVLPPEAAARAIAEAAALHRARGDHVLELVDAAIDDDRTVLVFPRMPRGSLAQLLASRAGLDAGEAVTALAPIAECLARMHRAGVAHGAVTAESVLFRGDGAPMLAGFGDAVCFEPGLPEVELERNEAVVADRRALVSLTLDVLTRVSGPRAPAAAELAARLRTAEVLPASELATRLFELAASRPVRFDVDDAPDATPRAVGVREVGEPHVADPPQRTVTAVERLLESGAGRVARSVAADVWRGWSPRRRRTVIAVAAVAGVLVIALPAIPSGAPPASETAELVATAEADGGEPGVMPSGVTGDDPLVALSALLDRRTECFRELSAECLDDVDEQGSSALDEDRAALDALVERGTQPTLLDADGAELTERLGDSAIVSLSPESQPASLLLLKGEAGWRIRDYVAGPDD